MGRATHRIWCSSRLLELKLPGRSLDHSHPARGRAAGQGRDAETRRHLDITFVRRRVAAQFEPDTERCPPKRPKTHPSPVTVAARCVFHGLSSLSELVSNCDSGLRQHQKRRRSICEAHLQPPTPPPTPPVVQDCRAAFPRDSRSSKQEKYISSKEKNGRGPVDVNKSGVSEKDGMAPPRSAKPQQAKQAVHF
jgi:hypothetical protein